MSAENVAEKKRTCFVVMGFGEKVDLASGRKLNLDASYQNLIKPTVEAAGLECVRADEIVHSGNINVPMYERILTSDLVIADLSTSNNNAFYELGVRHALRPYTTIIIAEDQFKFPFDIAQITVRTYKHLGDDIGVSEARRFSADLKAAIEQILAEEKDDSPVFTFLRRLRRLKLPDDMNYEPDSDAPDTAESAAATPGGAGVPTPEASQADTTHSVLMQQVAEAKKRGDFVTAKALLSTVRTLMQGPDKSEDPYIVQQLALATYKSKLPTPVKALEEARDILKTLDPATSNDTETLGLWGAVHKRLWDLTSGAGHLDEAVRGYERGFYLRNDYYNGINLAFLLNVRAEAVADFVQADRIRHEVIEICDALVKEDVAADESAKLSADTRYWVLATLAEAYLGIGDEEGAKQKFNAAVAAIPNPADNQWMRESTQEQMDKLRVLLADSPLKYVQTAGT
ncbi:MAG TPA: TRAFs-binding domain-containing protein [Pyrinomonadaceae bacterium]